MRIKKRGPLRSRTETLGIRASLTPVTTAAALALFLATPQSGMCYPAVEDSLRPQTRPNSPGQPGAALHCDYVPTS